MKKSIITSLIIIILTISILVAFTTLLIKNPKSEQCVINIEKIIKISQGTSNDIVFSDLDGDHYYINRGLERGLNLEVLNAKVLNKTVTLHLPKFWIGTSEHIAQLTVNDEVIFTEFD